MLWSFGDTFIAEREPRVRADARMIRNSVAIQHGYDPSTAFARFYWRVEDGAATSFLPDAPPSWHWPGGGLRRGDRLLWFAGEVYQDGPGDWGFAAGEWRAWLVENPDDEPPEWRITRAESDGERREIQLGGAVALIEPWLYVYGPGPGAHPPYLARFDADRAFQGDLRGPEWWTGSGFGAEAHRAPLFRVGAPEFSVHWAEPLGAWVYLAGSGFGSTTIAIRTAPRPEGPWTEPLDLLRPPESFWPDAFVYAAKAHPELRGADLIATYVPSSFADLPERYDETLYYPHFVRITYR